MNPFYYKSNTFVFKGYWFPGTQERWEHTACEYWKALRTIYTASCGVTMSLLCDLGQVILPFGLEKVRG